MLEKKINPLKYTNTPIEGILQATKWQFYWLCGLILCFAYERPLLTITPFDRTNPRIFDVMFFIGLILILPKLRKPNFLPKSFTVWKNLVYWFCFCALVWSIFFLPWSYGYFSLYAAARYLMGLLVIYMALLVPLNTERKRIIHGLLVICGIFVFIYTFLEYRGSIGGSSSVVLNQNLEVFVGEGVLVGPYGASYFQLAQSSALFFCFALTFFLNSKKNSMQYIMPLIVCIIGWPLVYSGARTGLGLALVSLIVLLIYNNRLRKHFLVFIVSATILIITTGQIDRVEESFASGTSFKRLEDNDGEDNSLAGRVSQTFDLSIWSTYTAGALLPLIGGGFYVAPIGINNEAEYRVDYGIHSVLLFPFEQAGVIGIFLFFQFIYYSVRDLLKRIKEKNIIDRNFALAFFSYLISSLIAGVGGHNFWQGFSSGNFNTCFIICLVLALSKSIDQ